MPQVAPHRISLLDMYGVLQARFGDLHWWPGESPLEVLIGAILTQNTAWKNVEAAISRLKTEGLLQVQALRRLPDRRLADLIRPSGYFRIKTKRLKAFLQFLQREYRDDLDRMFAEELPVLRKKLLSVYGIGEETADSMLLYAGEKPVFVVDAYTRRILQRHGVIGGKARYSEIQALFMNALPPDVPLFNQYHALLVQTGKQFCKKQAPLCRDCPLEPLRECFT